MTIQVFLVIRGKQGWEVRSAGELIAVFESFENALGAAEGAAALERRYGVKAEVVVDRRSRSDKHC
jgi:hypothetical protein